MIEVHGDSAVGSCLLLVSNSGVTSRRTKRPVTAFIVQVTDRLALMRIEVDCHPALAYACDMNRPGNSSSHRLFIGEASLSRNLI